MCAEVGKGGKRKSVHEVSRNKLLFGGNRVEVGIFNFLSLS